MSSVEYRGAIYEVGENEVVLDALIRGGADVTFSCRKGSCQSCILRARRGDPGARARAPLRAALAESGLFLPCVCRPDEDLVVEPADLSRVYMEALVAEKERAAPDVVRLRLEPAQQFDWTPGQYVNLRRADGLVRSYSIASVAASDYFLELHVRRVPGGEMSGWIHDRLAPGDTVDIQGPLGSCTYRPEFAGQPLLLVATGTGIAPLYGVARDALRQGHDRPIRVYHGGRTMEDLYLHEALRALDAEHPNLEYRPCLSGDDVPAGIRAGRVTEHAFGRDHRDAAGHAVYLCGNPDMVYLARYRAVGAGVARAAILADPFEPSHPYMPDDEAKLASVPPDPELWQALGRGTELRAILEDFYERVYADERLAPFFHNVTKGRSIAKQYAFLAEVFSGEDHYMGLSPFNAHHWMIISDDLFDYREDLFEACVRRRGLPEHLVRRWMAFHELFRRELVKARPRGLIMDGVEHDLEGFDLEELRVATLCDGCNGEIDTGATVRLHRRTGQLFCDGCAARSAPAQA